MKDQQVGTEIMTKVKRLEEGLQYIQLMTRTFANLRISNRIEVTDTVTALVSNFMGTRSAFTLLCKPESGELEVAASIGDSDKGSLVSQRTAELWRGVLQDKIPRTVAHEVVEGFLPAGGGEMACIAITLADESIGLMAVADRISGEPFTDEDLLFLSCASGFASMAIANANSHAEQQVLNLEISVRAEEARREAAEKEEALRTLDEKLSIIQSQQEAISELSTPVLQIWDGVIALPIIGIVDSRRSAEIMERLLSEIVARRSSHVILDITGVELVDTKTADHFIKVVRAAELLGARCIITGVRPAVAQTLVDLGIDLSSVTTRSNLREGLQECIRSLSANTR